MRVEFRLSFVSSDYLTDNPPTPTPPHLSAKTIWGAVCGQSAGAKFDW